MKHQIDYWMTRPSTRTLLFATLAALLFNQLSTVWLNHSYAASAFPVPYYVAQLSFSPEKIHAWYAYMISRGTLDIYIRTQHIDFIFILSTIFLHFLSLTLVSRVFDINARGRKVMILCAYISVCAPLADAAENLVSYVMLAQPLDFPDALAYLYSCLSSVKFAFFCFAYGAAPLGLLAGIAQRLSQGRRARPKA